MSQNHPLKVAAKGDREIVITRLFQAPRRFVFDAYTKPELMKQWLSGPDGWELAVCDVDLRIGGRYRFTWKSLSDGIVMGAEGEYREIVPPERLVNTERYDEAWYPGEALITLVLTERNEVTTMELTLLYESQDARDMVIKSPMEDGLEMSFARLEQLVIGMK